MRIAHRFIHSLLTSALWWAGVVISIGLYFFTSHWVTEKCTAEFEYQSSNAQMAVQMRVQSYIDVLRGAHALFATRDQVTRDEFRAYVVSMDLRRSFPGIDNLNFAQTVSAGEKQAFVKSVRQDTSINREGYPGFSIKPPGERPEYHVLTYLEPMKDNESTFGLDIEAVVPQAVINARDTGEIISSGKIIRIDNRNDIGVAMRMPLYRRNMPTGTVNEKRRAYYGSVGAGFNLNKLLDGALNKDVLRLIRLRLYDAGPADAPFEPAVYRDKHMIFDTGAQGSHAAPSANMLVRRAPIRVASRIWEAEFSTPKSAMVSKIDLYVPWYVLASGLLATTLLYSIYYFLISTRQRAMEMAADMTKDLRASEANLEEAQRMARLGSWVLDLDTGRMSWSTQGAAMCGLQRHESGLTFDEFLSSVHAFDRERIRAGIEQTMIDGGEFNAEHRIVLGDGAIHWVQSVARIDERGSKRVLRGTLMDVTERKETMETLQRSQELLRELTMHQDRIKEEERKRIAREIHDELGQTLLALRIDVSMLDTRTAESHPKLNRKVREALGYLDATVRTVRTIINNLRPAVLDLGLVPAIEWQIDEFRRRTGIDVELRIEESELVLGDACNTTLFRILQESLTNVTKHSFASKVCVELTRTEDSLVMKIADNGKGIRQEHAGKRRSFGLVGIEERVLALNGRLTIESGPGTGTCLTVRIPMANNKRSAMSTAENLAETDA